MTEVEMNVDPGVCRFMTVIKAKCEDGMTVELDITSGCPAISKLGKEFKSIVSFEAVSMPLNSNPLFVECAKHVLHAACPVPVALVKVCEVAGDLGLKKDVTLKYV